jgi:glycosyltransferase involved in cell wall biosynthesis/SAM-dependent methyltransferase
VNSDFSLQQIPRIHGQLIALALSPESAGPKVGLVNSGVLPMNEEGISGTVEKSVPTDKHQDALRLYAEGRVREAMTLLGSELCREETAKGWNDWAVMQTACNLQREAEEGYRRALTLDPRYVSAAAKMGLLMSEQDRVEEALPFLEFASQERGGKLEREYREALKTCRAKKETLPKQPDRETLKAYLRQFAPTDPNDLLYFEGHLHRFLGTLAFLPPASGQHQRALELGTASHYMTPSLLRWKNYERVSCADIWDGEPQCTRRVVSSDGKEEFSFVIDNFDLQSAPWPYPEESFDLVLLCEILEHLVADPMGVLSGINRVLKVGGHLLLTVPNIASARSAEAVLHGEAPYIYGKYQPGGRPTDRHNREYAPAEIVRLAAAAGFGLAKIQTYNSWWVHGKELARLASGGLPISLRGDTVFYLGRKDSEVMDRYPDEFYELTGTQRQRREMQAQKASGELPTAVVGDDRRRVLVVHELLPEYDRSGSEQRHWQVLKALLARGYAVTYVARHAMNKDRYISEMSKMGITVYAHDIERLAYRGLTGPVEWTFEEVLKNGQFDVAFLLTWFWSGISTPEHYMDAIRKISPETRVITVCDDPHGPREMALAKMSGNIVDFERAKDFEQRETEIYTHADLVVTVSETNRQNLLAMCPGLDIEILPNEAESLVDDSPGLSFEERKDLLFLGDFANLANRDGMKWFIEEVWPRIRKEVPGVKLNLAGSNMDKKYATEFEDIERLGFVPDLKPLFAAHKVFISPARYGISTRTKNLNALAMGLPVVTTAAGAEGLYLRNEKEALLAESPEDFAAAVCRLYRAAGLWKSLAERGRAHIRDVFSKKRLETRLVEIIEKALPIQPRKYDPEHTWSAMLVERRFPKLLDPEARRVKPLVRAMCHLRLAEQLLEAGKPAAAREQIRHVFGSMYGNMGQHSAGARVFRCLARCYHELGEEELAARCNVEEQRCLLPVPETAAVEEIAPKGKSKSKNRLRISVIVPTYNRRETLSMCLAALAAQSTSAKEFEVIVVEDGSTDETEEFCSAFKPPFAFDYVRQDNAGAGAARRMGVQRARGEYLLLFNDDTIASRDLVAKHLQTQQKHQREKLAVLGNFRYLPAAADRALTYYLGTSPFLFPQASLKAGVHAESALFVTCNLSVRRDAVLAAGSFNPEFRVAEDTDLGIRLMRTGFRVLYVPDAVAMHEHLPFTIGDLIRRAENYAPAQLLLFHKYPEMLGDGSGPFGRLDEASIAKIRDFVTRREEEVQAAVRALRQFDTVDFKPFFSRNLGARTAAEEVMELFSQSVPDIYFYFLFANFLKAWDEEPGFVAAEDARNFADGTEVRV